MSQAKEFGKRRVVSVASLALGVSLLSPGARTASAASAPGDVTTSGPISVAARASDCLSRSPDQISAETGTRVSSYLVKSPPDDHTYDLRGLVVVQVPPYADIDGVIVGRHAQSPNPCVVGGEVVGAQSRGLGWRDVKGDYDGAGLEVTGRGTMVVDGLRVDNVEDGLVPIDDPRDTGSLVARNLYMTYVRDDCIENDWSIVGGIVEDSLFDGCNMFLSVRPTAAIQSRLPPTPDDETFTLDGVLVRLLPMPDPRANKCRHPPDCLEHAELFKLSSFATRIVVKNSIFLIEQMSKNGPSAMNWPSGVSAENVTLVWAGDDNYPGTLPPGVTEVHDRSVYENARKEWLERQGYLNASGLVAPPLSGVPGNGRVDLEWTDVHGARSYTVKRSRSSSGPYATVARGITAKAAGYAAYEDTSVTNDTTYYYVVVAVNTGGQESKPSNELPATPQVPAAVPAAPTGLSVTSGNGSVTLRWNPVPSAARYIVKRTGGQDPSNCTAGVNTQARGLTEPVFRDTKDMSFGHGLTWGYTVFATSTGGESEGSNTVCGTPKATALP